MLIDEIESLRECLNSMVSEHGSSKKEILRVSRELDILILHYLEQSVPQK